jgi:ribonuclease BN (tRNA processing enzyme)
VAISVTILGAGTIAPSKSRNASGVIVRTRDLWILVDIGPGIIRRLVDAGIDLRWIDVVLITHFHPDHVSDLIPFLFASNYAHDTPRKEPFYTIGPEGFEAFHDALVKIYGRHVVPTGNRRIGKELSAGASDSFSLGSVVIKSRPARHEPPAISYRIEENGASVTISGDTDFNPELQLLAQGTDILICEASFPDELKHAGHLTAGEAGMIADAAQAKKLVLTHLYPPAEADIVSQARKHYSGEVVKAEDFMKFDIG